MDFVLGCVVWVHLEVLGEILPGFFIPHFNRVNAFWQTVSIVFVLETTILINNDFALMNRGFVAVRISNNYLNVSVRGEFVADYGDFVAFSNGIRQHSHDRVFRVVCSIICGVISLVHLSIICGVISLVHLSIICGVISLVHLSIICGVISLVHLSIICGVISLVHLSIICGVISGAWIKNDK
ncbi:hypothetical protein D3C74_86660 [compost metagenome]